MIFNQGNQCQQIGLFEVIKFGLLEKKLNAFYSDDFNEAAKNRIDPAQIKNLIAVNDTIRENVFDAQGNEVVNTRVENRYLYTADVKAYVLKEDWFLDSYTGKLEKKIVAFAPLVTDHKTGMSVPLFWLYYNEWKELLRSFEAKNLVTDEVISYRTLLEKNYFISVVSKESNLFDRSVKDYQHGQDPQQENETIREKIYNSERDAFPK